MGEGSYSPKSQLDVGRLARMRSCALLTLVG